MKLFSQSPQLTYRQSHVVSIALIASSSLFVPACAPKPPRQPQSEGESKPVQAADEQQPQRRPRSSPGSPEAARSAADEKDPSKAAPQTASPVRPKPSGKPSPEAQSGHAVAFAGWKPSKDGTRDVLMLCDPGDNAIEGRTLHGWDAKPREFPVYFGRRRPTVVLLPAGTFTITGAVVVAAAGADKSSSSSIEPVTATGMPDLSQDLNPSWIGLCGSTSGANVLFFMGQQNPRLVQGFPRGPSEEADAGVMKIVVGDRGRIQPDSLAGRMGTSEDGVGATNLGMRAGMESWLDEHDKGRWAATLDWFDDREKSRDQQRQFLSRLAASVRAGGGAILCLWPGTEYSDSAVSEEPVTSASADRTEPREAPPEPAPSRSAAPNSADAGPREPLPDAAFPSLPPAPADSRPTLPGRPASGLTEREAVDQAKREIDAARNRLESNSPARAFDHVSRAVTLLRQHGGDGADAAALLADAIALSKEIDRRLPAPSGKALQKRTVFQ